MPIDLLDTGLPQTFNLLKKNALSVKRNKTKYNKMRSACIGVPSHMVVNFILQRKWTNS